MTRQGVINTDAAVTRWSQGGRKAVISTRKALINKALINKALINKALIKAVTALVAVINTGTQH